MGEKIHFFLIFSLYVFSFFKLIIIDFNIYLFIFNKNWNSFIKIWCESYTPYDFYLPRINKNLTLKFENN